MVRHVEDGTDTAVDKARSARRIVSSLLKRGEVERPMVLRLQRELVNEGKTLEETLAGQSICHDIREAQEHHALNMQELGNRLAVELRRRNSGAVEDLRRRQEDLASIMASADSEMRDLRCALKEMHEREHQAVTDRIGKIDMRFRQKLATKSQELADLEDSVRLLQEDAAQQGEQRKRSEQEGAEREMVETRRAEMQKSVYQPFVITQATVSPDSPASPTSPAPLPYTTPSQHNNSSSISNKAQLAIVRRSSEPTNWAKRLEKNQEGHAAKVDDLRNKVARYRESYDKFKGKTASILTGVANGLAGGVTSGTIAPLVAGSMLVAS